MENPRGKLIAIGGGEDKDRKKEVLNRILDETHNREGRIEVITSASKIPEEVGREYITAFENLGCKNVGVIHIDKREEAANPEYIERVDKASAVLFSGGDQLRLSTILGGTDFIKRIESRYYNDDFIVAGTSAGAAAMSNTMIFKGSSSEALLKGEVQITTGLAFIKDVIIDTHFVTRGRFGRLIQAVVSNPSCIGIGLGEDTGVIINDGNYLETIGSGLVIIVDGHGVAHTNLADIQDGEPISVNGIMLHVMAKGDCYNIIDRKFSQKAD